VSVAPDPGIETSRMDHVRLLAATAGHAETIEMLATANAKRLVLLFNPVVGGAVLEAP
jgi:hypothetical protein